MSWNQDLSYLPYSSPRIGRLEFDAQVRKAIFSDTWRWLTRRRCDLVKFDDVVRWRSRHLRCPPQFAHVLIHQIVGSVGQTKDFTRDFLLRAQVNGARGRGLFEPGRKGLNCCRSNSTKLAMSILLSMGITVRVWRGRMAPIRLMPW